MSGNRKELLAATELSSRGPILRRFGRWSLSSLAFMVGAALLISCTTSPKAIFEPEPPPEPIPTGEIYPGIVTIYQDSNLRTEPRLGEDTKFLGQWDFVISINGLQMTKTNYHFFLENPFIEEGDNVDDKINQNFYSNYWARMDGFVRSGKKPEGIRGIYVTLYNSLGRNSYSKLDRDIRPIKVNRQPDGSYLSIDETMVFENPGRPFFNN